MEEITKGTKARFNGVILTKKEYNEYKKLKELIQTLKTYKKDYNMTYRNYLM